MKSRPSLQTIIAIASNTVRCQFHNSAPGRKLKALEPAMHAALEKQLASNLASVIDGIITELTDIEATPASSAPAAMAMADWLAQAPVRLVREFIEIDGVLDLTNDDACSQALESFTALVRWMQRRPLKPAGYPH